jgi:hypothetical protein
MSYSVVLRPARDEGFLGQRINASAPVPVLFCPKTHSRLHGVTGKPSPWLRPTRIPCYLSQSHSISPPSLPLTAVFPDRTQGRGSVR